MTDRTLLEEIIRESGLRKNFIASQLGITTQGFRLKLNGENEFRESEMQKLSELLGMSKATRDKVFFAKKVDKLSTISMR